MTKVKAAVMLGPGKIEMREFTKPELEPDGVWLKVEFTGICGTDKHSYQGHASYNYPLIPGHEFVGTIAEIGPRANDTMVIFGGPLKEGDRVAVAPGSKGCGRCWYCLNAPLRTTLCPNRFAYGFVNVDRPPHLWGGFAEYIYLNGASWVFKIPDGMPLEVAVLAEPTATAIRGLAKGFQPGIPLQGEGYGPNKSVVVLGAGPIGLFTIGALKFTGAAKVIAIDMLDSRLEYARAMGADEVINAKRTTFEERLRLVREMTEGVGCDVLVEAAGVPSAFREGLELVRRGGVFLEVGHFTDPGAVEIHPFVICNRDLTIHGSWGYPQLQFKDALAFLARTQAPVRDLVTHIFPLDELEKAIQLSGTEGTCKVLIKP